MSATSRSLVGATVTLWFSADVVHAWEHDNDAKKNGRPFVYSDVAIETQITIRELFRLPYRQTAGLGQALAKLLGAPIVIPTTSVQKRAAKLGVAITLPEVKARSMSSSTAPGLKVLGEGEWKVRQHGAGQRLTWRKLHLAVNQATHQIVAEVLTESSHHDADQVELLLAQVEVEVQMFYSDRAYDQWKMFHALQEHSIWSIIPPRRNAKIKQHGNSAEEPLERDECLR